MNGELIGINSVKVSSSSVEGMGYAIPISFCAYNGGIIAVFIIAEHNSQFSASGNNMIICDN